MTKTMLVFALVVAVAAVHSASATDTYDGASSWADGDIFNACHNLDDTPKQGMTCCGSVKDADRVAFCTDPKYPNKYKAPNPNAGMGEDKIYDSLNHCAADPCDPANAEDRFSCCRTTKACFGKGSESDEKFGASIANMSLVGLFICAIPSIILGSLPACCGKMVEKRMLMGGVGILLGFLALISPMAAASVAAGTACTATCEHGEDCGPCSKDVMDGCKVLLGALGVFVAIVAGFPAVVLGIVGMSISGAAMCGCCKANPAQAAASAAPAVVAQKA